MDLLLTNETKAKEQKARKSINVLTEKLNSQKNKVTSKAISVHEQSLSKSLRRNKKGG